MPAVPTGYGPAVGTGYGPAMGTGYGPTPGSFTAADLAAVRRHRIGIAIFHDGNPGHLWRGELASQLGEAVLSAGVVMWVVVLIGGPLAVAAAVLALALPAVLVRPFAARLENVQEPRVPLIWIGRLRILLALGLIAMHFHTIVPALYGLLFGVALMGRLRDAARTAAFRTCLAPGETAHVANDLHVGAVIAAVLGPLLAALFFILLGERILLVSIGGAVLFLLSVNSDGFLDALPRQRRAFLLATPEMAIAEGGVPDAPLDHPEDDGAEGAAADPEQQRELGLPEWYQQGPRSARQAFADIRAGLGLAGQRRPGLLALLAVAALALVSGGLAVLEVFYITDAVGLPTFYLGPLLAAEGAGAALGMLLAGSSAKWRLRLLGGTITAGLALMALAHVPLMPAALLLALIFGAGSAVALVGARTAFHAEHTGVERRAIAAAEQWLAALCGVVGAAGFTALFEDTFAGHHRLGAAIPGWPIDVLLSLMGFGLAVAGVLLAVVPGLASKQKARRKAKGKGKGKAKGKGRAGDLDDAGWDDASGYFPAAGDDWDDEGAYDSTMQPAFGDTGYQTGYQTGYDTSYQPGYGETGEYETGYQTGYSQSYTGEYDARGSDTTFGRSTEYERGYTGEYGRYDDEDDARGGSRGGAPRGGRGGRR